MKRIFLISICGIFLFSCEQKEEIPTDILAQADMVNILMGVHVAEATVGLKNLPAHSARQLFMSLEREIFASNKTDKAKYAKSYKYYMTKVELMDGIYSKVIDSLSLREAKALHKNNTTN